MLINTLSSSDNLTPLGVPFILLAMVPIFTVKGFNDRSICPVHI